MTKEEAKSFLIAISYDLGNMAVEYLSEKDGEKMREAIKALEQQPCEEYNYKALWEQVKWERDVATEQLEQLGYSLGEKIRTSEDCIRRQALIEKATSWDKHFADSERYVSLTDIQKAPSVTPQPKRGKWEVIRKEYEFMGGVVNEAQGCKCSNCGGIVKLKSDFCPNCGADMREVEELLTGEETEGSEEDGDTECTMSRMCSTEETQRMS